MKFVKGLRHVPYGTALQRLRLFSLVRRRIGIYKIMHGLLDFFSDTIFAAPPALGFEIILSRFINSGVKPVAVNVHLAFE